MKYGLFNAEWVFQALNIVIDSLHFSLRFVYFIILLIIQRTGNLIESHSQRVDVSFKQIQSFPNLYFNIMQFQKENLFLKNWIHKWDCPLSKPISNLKPNFILILFLIIKIHPFPVISDTIAILIHFHNVPGFDISMSNIIQVHEDQTQD